VIKFLSLQAKGYRAVHREVTTILAKEAISIETVKRQCRRFKDGDFSVTDHEKPGRPPCDLSNVIIRYSNAEPFLSARTLANSLTTDHQTIETALERDLGPRRFTRKCVHHQFTIDQKQKRVLESRELVEFLRQELTRILLL
jgi:hypothetical protein